MLEEKIDLLTKEIVGLRKALEENTAAAGGSGGGAAADKPAGRGRGRPPKNEEVEPKHSADEVEKLIRQVRSDIGKEAAVAIIKTKFKCADLADLLTKPALFDDAYAAAEKALEENSGSDDDDDGI